MRTFCFAVGLAAATLGAAACADNAGSSATSPSTTAAPPPGAITIDVFAINGNQSFSPNPATVPPAHTVVWHNVDSVTHRVVLDNGHVDTGSIPPGAFSAPMTLEGSGAYHCAIHPSMVGSITGAG